eukprot:gnl/TRDRNA2_/TRDRNA2_136677_c0_seq1.p1 gnl/TRDRNA2_/TRDRNA2_136677_c0~~gnl/TRDRNA2_/TRDRNA2_136677_c0_seq1.p1  ORF type:complete len:515 (-),score=129.73 gnl/TRDRNA2_/TRDRNA2_136677_c0_seq1:49-1593(-)
MFPFTDENNPSHPAFDQKVYEKALKQFKQLDSRLADLFTFQMGYVHHELSEVRKAVGLRIPGTQKGMPNDFQNDLTELAQEVAEIRKATLNRDQQLEMRNESHQEFRKECAALAQELAAVRKDVECQDKQAIEHRDQHMEMRHEFQKKVEELAHELLELRKSSESRSSENQDQQTVMRQEFQKMMAVWAHELEEVERVMSTLRAVETRIQTEMGKQLVLSRESEDSVAKLRKLRADLDAEVADRRIAVADAVHSIQTEFAAHADDVLKEKAHHEEQIKSSKADMAALEQMLQHAIVGNKAHIDTVEHMLRDAIVADQTRHNELQEVVTEFVTDFTSALQSLELKREASASDDQIARSEVVMLGKLVSEHRLEVDRKQSEHQNSLQRIEQELRSEIARVDSEGSSRHAAIGLLQEIKRIEQELRKEIDRVESEGSSRFMALSGVHDDFRGEQEEKIGMFSIMLKTLTDELRQKHDDTAAMLIQYRSEIDKKVDAMLKDDNPRDGRAKLLASTDRF